MKTIYSITNLTNIIWFVLVPLLIVLVVYFIFINLYSASHEKKYPNRTNYIRNYWSSLIGIIFGSVLFAVSIGFALAFTQTVRNLNAIEQNKFFYYFFMVFPIIPFIFLITFIKRFITNLNKRYILEKETNQVNEENMQINDNIQPHPIPNTIIEEKKNEEEIETL